MLATAVLCASLAGCGGSGNSGSGGGGATVSITPSSLSFGSVGLGASSGAQTVTVANTGSSALAVSGVAVNGDFAIATNTCGSSLAVGGNCTVGVVFTPTAAGARSGTLSLTTNAGGSPQQVALTGTGTTAAVTLSPGSFAFGSVALGGTSPFLAVKVTNSGTATLSIQSVTLSGDFANTTATANLTDGCGSTLAVSASCEIAVSFVPTTVGARTGSFSLVTNAPGTAPSIALSGTGAALAPALSPTSIAFGTVNLGSTSAVQYVTIGNVGSTGQTISGVTLSGDYQQVGTGCPGTIPVGGSCLIGVQFVPTLAGPRTGTLTVTSSSAASPQTVALSGTGAVPVTYAGSSFAVTVLAGTRPLAGASVQVLAAGTKGSGSAATPLVPTALLTDPTGTVTVPAGYLCPTSTAMVYVVSSGGGVSGGAANANVRLMTAVGACNGIASGTKYTVNEATTVGAAYALAQFAGSGVNFGATGTNPGGLSNAFGTAATLADPVTGATPGTSLPANGTLPVTRINTVANLLNGCVVSATSCAGLFAATTAGGVTPANTLEAALNLARNPAANVASIYTLAQNGTAYAPALTAAPADWTMFVSYSGGGLNSPSAVGVDSGGNVWVADYFFAASKFTPQGAAVFPNGVTGAGLNNSYGLAIDLKDNVWIPNEQPYYSDTDTGSVTELSSAGVSLSGAQGFTSGGLEYPISVSIDPNGTVWVLDYGNSHLTLLNSQGVPISGNTGYTTSLFAFPVAVAVDNNQAGWVANQASSYVTRVSADGTSFSNYCCTPGASGLALDTGGNVWTANFYGDSVSLVGNNGKVIGSGTYTGNGGISRPQGIAIDGTGNVWVANYRQTYLTELQGVGASGLGGSTVGQSLSPKTGFGSDAALLEAYALAIDASGNIWVANQGNNTLTKFVGLATPVRTPLSALPRLP